MKIKKGNKSGFKCLRRSFYIFKEIRDKYSEFEGNLKGVDSSMLVKQVPGGMLSNLESQLRANKQEDKIDLVKDEIPRVRKDFGYPPW